MHAGLQHNPKQVRSSWFPPNDVVLKPRSTERISAISSEYGPRIGSARKEELSISIDKYYKA